MKEVCVARFPDTKCNSHLCDAFHCTFAPGGSILFQAQAQWTSPRGVSRAGYGRAVSACI